jgi:CRP-like cAMP-binding protein
MPVRDRIHAELARMALQNAKAAGTIDPMPTHSEIANRVSTHREAVTRELLKLEKEGVVSRRGRSLIVLNIEMLRKG